MDQKVNNYRCIFFHSFSLGPSNNIAESQQLPNEEPQEEDGIPPYLPRRSSTSVDSGSGLDSQLVHDLLYGSEGDDEEDESHEPPQPTNGKCFEYF